MVENLSINWKRKVWMSHKFKPLFPPRWTSPINFVLAIYNFQLNNIQQFNNVDTAPSNNPNSITTMEMGTLKLNTALCYIQRNKVKVFLFYLFFIVLCKFRLGKVFFSRIKIVWKRNLPCNSSIGNHIICQPFFQNLRSLTDV